MTVPVHVCGRKRITGEDREGVLVRLDAVGRGRIHVGDVEGVDGSWATESEERRQRMVALLEGLEDVADGRRIRRECEGAFHVLADRESGVVREVWVFQPVLRESVDAEGVWSVVVDATHP